MEDRKDDLTPAKIKVALAALERLDDQQIRLVAEHLSWEKARPMFLTFQEREAQQQKGGKEDILNNPALR